MSITDAQLKLEVGSEAYNELTSDEVSSLLSAYDNARLAGMKTFELLMKKFQPTYRMGRMYEKLSEKFEHYWKIYNWYAQSMGSGKLANEDLGNERNVERYKFLETSHPKQETLDESSD